jgi:hypothetical protein
VWTHSCSAALVFACWEPCKASMFKMSPPEIRKHFVPGLFLRIVLRAKQKSCIKGADISKWKKVKREKEPPGWNAPRTSAADAWVGGAGASGLGLGDGGFPPSTPTRVERAGGSESLGVKMCAKGQTESGRGRCMAAAFGWMAAH